MNVVPVFVLSLCCFCLAQLCPVESAAQALGQSSLMSVMATAIRTGVAKCEGNPLVGPLLKARISHFRHGKYCGGNWGNGKIIPPGEKNDVCKTGVKLVAPTDKVDAACRVHDIAYCSEDPAVRNKADLKIIADLKKARTPLAPGSYFCKNVLAKIPPGSKYAALPFFNGCYALQYADALIPAFQAKTKTYDCMAKLAEQQRAAAEGGAGGGAGN